MLIKYLSIQLCLFPFYIVGPTYFDLQHMEDQDLGFSGLTNICEYYIINKIMSDK